MNSAYFYIDLFNTREKAVIVWLIIFLVWALSRENIRNSFLVFLKTLFQQKILLVIIALLLYTGLIVLIFSKVGIWEVALIKNTTFWLVGTAFVLLMNADKATQDKGFFKKILIDNLKLILVIEFIVNLYTFSLGVELILVPILFVIVAMGAVAETEQEFMIVKKITDFILSAFGVSLIVVGLIKVLGDYQAFATSENLRAFILPPLLTFAYIPFLYLFALLMAYESLFVRMEIILKVDQRLGKSAKQKIFALCHFNLVKLNSFSKEFILEIVNLSDENNLLNIIKKVGNHSLN